jgi:hypothetical protein
MNLLAYRGVEGGVIYHRGKMISKINTFLCQDGGGGSYFNIEK